MLLSEKTQIRLLIFISYLLENIAQVVKTEASSAPVPLSGMRQAE